jgi:hypothetical protein
VAARWEWVRPAATVIAVAFTVHLVNGLLIEPTWLGFESYQDYADATLLADAVGSAAWIASGLGHLATAAAVVVLAVVLRDRFAGVDPTRASLLHGFALVAAAGFALDGIGNLSAGQATHLLAEANPASAEAAFVALSVLVVAVNALAIASLGVVWWLLWSLARSAAVAPRWPAVLAAVAGTAGLVMALVVLPVYLLLYWAAAVSLAWVAPRWAADAVRSNHRNVSKSALSPDG